MKNKYFSSILILTYFLWILVGHIFSSQYTLLIHIWDIEEESFFRNINIFFFFLLITNYTLMYKVNKDTVIDITIIVMVAICAFTTNKSGTLLNLFLFIIISKNIKFELIVKAFIAATLSASFIIFLSDSLGVFPDISSLDLYREDGTYRHLMGYTFPTLLPAYFFHLSISYVFIRKDKLSLVELLILLSLNQYMYIMTDTKAVYYSIVMLALVCIFINKFNISYQSSFPFKNILIILTKWGFILSFILAAGLQCLYDPSIDWMNDLNQMLSGRLQLGRQGFDEYGIKLFGSNVEYVSFSQENKDNKYFFIDSSYQQLLINYGLVLSSILAIGFYTAGKIIAKKNDIYLGISIIFLFLHSITDPQLMLPSYNPFIFIIIYGLSNKYRNNLSSDRCLV